MFDRLGPDLVTIDGEFYRRLRLGPTAIDVAELDGHLYVLYEGRDYYSPIGPDSAKRQALHREIWKRAHGPIPPGHDIHHADENPRNNDLDNLVCITRAEHRRLHGQTWPSERAMVEHLADIRQQAAEWHRSEEGRAWHVEHGRRTWEGRQARTIECVECGRKFRTRYAGRVGLCSQACRNRVAAKNPANYVERSCVECGGSFTAWKYGRQRYCGRTCANRVRARNQHATRRARLQPDGGG